MLSTNKIVLGLSAGLVFPLGVPFHLLWPGEIEARGEHLTNQGQDLGILEQFPKNPLPPQGEAGTRPIQNPIQPPTPTSPACRLNPCPAWCHFSMGLWRWRFTSGV